MTRSIGGPRVPHIPSFGRQHRESADREFEAQPLLGHSNLSTTADVYTHTSVEAERGAALALEQAIYGDLFVNVREIANKNSKAALQ